MSWQLADINLNSRFLLGTAAYPSLEILTNAIKNSATEMITVSLTRSKFNHQDNHFFNAISQLNCHLLPNTAGCYFAKDAVNTAKLAREIFKTSRIKLEIIGDDYTLQPNLLQLLKATEELIKDGFIVFPYCTDDLMLCQELYKLGCQILMPMASPIGSGQGILNQYNLRLLRERLPECTLIIDAGIGSPSDAALAMELGFDGILLNSAVSQALDPAKMAQAFKQAIDAGHLAYQAGLMPKLDFAKASTPYLNRPFAATSEIV